MSHLGHHNLNVALGASFVGGKMGEQCRMGVGGGCNNCVPLQFDPHSCQSLAVKRDQGLQGIQTQCQTPGAQMLRSLKLRLKMEGSLAPGMRGTSFLFLDHRMHFRSTRALTRPRPPPLDQLLPGWFAAVPLGGVGMGGGWTQA